LVSQPLLKFFLWINIKKSILEIFLPVLVVTHSQIHTMSSAKCPLFPEKSLDLMGISLPSSKNLPIAWESYLLPLH
jgi:hypothetical protein